MSPYLLSCEKCLILKIGSQSKEKEKLVLKLSDFSMRKTNISKKKILFLKFNSFSNGQQEAFSVIERQNFF